MQWLQAVNYVLYVPYRNPGAQKYRSTIPVSEAFDGKDGG